MKKEIGKCRIDEIEIFLQLNGDKLELIVKNPYDSSHIVSRTFALDLAVVWQEVKPYFISKIKKLK